MTEPKSEQEDWLDELTTRFMDYMECEEYHIHDGTGEHEGETPLPYDFDEDKLKAAITAKIAELLDSRITGETSDGYHTFNELYEFRMLYNAALFNEWRGRESVLQFDVHKSWHHSDGEKCFGGGWFVVVAQLPTGQITNHYEEKYYDLFKIPYRTRAAKWDGHTPQDVSKRLTAYLQGSQACLSRLGE